MENRQTLVLQLEIGRRRLVFLVSLLLLSWHPALLESETLTLTTYYPAPYGGYVSMLTTGETYLARDTGTVGINTGSATLDHSVKLQVEGNVKITGGSPAFAKVLTSNSSGFADWQHPLSTCHWQSYAYGSTSVCSAAGYAGAWVIVAGKTSGAWSPNNTRAAPAYDSPRALMFPYSPIIGVAIPWWGNDADFSNLPANTMFSVTPGRLMPESGRMLCCRANYQS